MTGASRAAATRALQAALGRPAAPTAAGGPVTRLAVVVAVLDLDDDGAAQPRQVTVRFEGDTVPSERALLSPGGTVPTVAAGDRVLLLAAGSTWVVVANLSADAPSPPYGTVVVSALPGAVAPPGWLRCDGQAVSRTTYARLFEAIGTSFGTGNGTTTFTLPAMTPLASGRLPYVIRAS